MYEQNLKPENCYFLDNSMSIDKIYRAKESGKFLVANVISWDSTKKALKVNLGNHFQGEIPLNEISIYPTAIQDNSISAEISTQIGKNVCVAVKEINRNSIVLSRKDNMIKAFSIISKQQDAIINCQITGIANFGVFVDIGHGIHGLIHTIQLCKSRINSPSDIGYQKGQIIKARITSIDLEKHFVDMSHKDLFENLAEVHKVGDVIQVITLKRLNSDGYFCHINPNTSGVIDTNGLVEIPYGSKVTAMVKEPRLLKDGSLSVKLNFITYV